MDLFMETNQQKVQIVVARYNENLDWLSPMSHICKVYNKGDDSIANSINLPNVGRESHTYLHHIIENYDSLSEITLFIQGRITDHHTYRNDIEFINQLISDAVIYGYSQNAHMHNVGFLGAYSYLKMANKWKNLKDSGQTFGEWMTDVMKLGNREYDKYKMLKWYRNGIFSLSKERIHAYPKSFYENLLKYVDNHVDPETGHYFERAWYEIFIGTFENKK